MLERKILGAKKEKEEKEEAVKKKKKEKKKKEKGKKEEEKDKKEKKEEKNLGTPSVKVNKVFAVVRNSSAGCLDENKTFLAIKRLVQDGSYGKPKSHLT